MSAVRPPERAGWMRRHAMLLLVLAAYFAAAVCYLVLTPLWQAPDEPAHFNYVRYLATTDELPVLRQGDYPAQYLEQLKAAHFPPDQSIAPIRYESHQPPLFYALAGPVYQAVWASPLSAQVLALRLVSVVLGLVAVWLTYLLGLRLWPERTRQAAALAGIAALVPMHTAVSAAISNDMLAEVLVLATALQSLRLFRRGGTSPGRLWPLGLLVGLCLLTKMTAFLALGLALTAIALAWWRQRPSSAYALRGALAFVVPLLALEGPWLLRSMATYGLADPLGQARHDSIVVGQLRTSQLLAQSGLWALLRQGAVTTFRSFWGVFGWMGVPMDERLYLGFALVTALAAIGLLLRLWQVRHRLRSAPELFILMFVWGGFSTAQLLWYNLKFVQYQGRYLFVAMPVWAAALTVGLIEVRRHGLAFALGLLALAGAVLGAGLLTGAWHRLTAAGLGLAGLAIAAWWAAGRRWPVLAGGVALVALWLVDLAGALYYVRTFL